VITLVLGGARSGKSVVAERLAAKLPEPVTYVATGMGGGGGADEDMAARVAVHQARRPSSWRTLEAGLDLVDALASVEGSVLLDSLGSWVAATPAFAVDAAAIGYVLQLRRGDTVIVSEEVGLGVHPATETGRRFRDALGEVNQAMATIADEVLLVVAGRALRLEHFDEPA
jgi:adenosylcobinamide kinase/adenosylcobinamide-phosphate guanylyltransferase